MRQKSVAEKITISIHVDIFSNEGPRHNSKIKLIVFVPATLWPPFGHPAISLRQSQIFTQDMARCTFLDGGE